ncbi:MAG: NADPH-dependent FMN reductase [Polyangia bacterium]|jgi:NAD(P)H-dependent FMN reductase
MLKLLVVVTSTREARVGHLIADWAMEQVRAHGKFESELSDLKTVGLPLLDEPNHPRLGQYKHAHTKAWSATVSAADAFLFVTPEYNYSMPPALLNALDYLVREWAYKPAAFVSYGGQSGGMRSVQSAKTVLTSLKIMPLPEAVAIPFMSKFIKDGRFEGDESQAKAAVAMLDELHKWAGALATLRAPAP